MMTPPTHSAPADDRPFWAGDVRVEPELQRLVDADGERRLGSRPMALLQYLAARPGRLAAKDDIIEAVWGGRAVSDDSLSVAVYEVRKALGDDARRPRFIETLTAKGYRWLPEVTWERAEPVAGGVTGDTTPAATGDDAPAVASVTDRARRWPALAAGGAGLLATALVAASLALSDPPRQASYQTLAVLPLADYSPEWAGDRSFADGMTESLIQALARRGPLQVISRTSVYRFAATSPELSMSEIAERLGADLLIEGSVTRAGDEVRITVQLIEGATDRHLWASSYQAHLGNVLDLQWRVSEAVAGQIGRQAPVAAEPRAGPPAARPALAVEAVDAYLEGRQAFLGASVADLRAAVASFRRAVELEPDFAEAHAGLALSAAALYPWSDDRPATLSAARRACRRALELDPTLPEAHAALGEISLLGVADLDGARAAFEQGLRLDPTSTDALWGLGWLALLEGRFAEAEQLAERARKADPLSIYPHRTLFRVGLYSGRLHRARQLLERTRRQLGSDATWDLQWELCHRLPSAEQVWQCYRPLFERFAPDFAAECERTFERSGLDGLLELILERGPFVPSAASAAAVRMRLGQHGAALELLESALSDWTWRVLEIDADPAFEPLRGEPRFEAVRRRLGLGRVEAVAPGRSIDRGLGIP